VVDVCGENASGNLSCSFGAIKVLSAFYGRTSYNTCKQDPMNTYNCKLDILTNVGEM
jgi:hypothetical protein